MLFFFIWQWFYYKWLTVFLFCVSVTWRFHSNKTITDVFKTLWTHWSFTVIWAHLTPFSWCFVISVSQTKTDEKHNHNNIQYFQVFLSFAQKTNTIVEVIFLSTINGGKILNQFKMIEFVTTVVLFLYVELRMALLYFLRHLSMSLFQTPPTTCI